MPASGYVAIRLLSWYMVAHGARVRSIGEISSKISGKDLSVMAMTICVQLHGAGHIMCRTVTL